MYFKHDNYLKFTSNESKYWIETDKYFIPYGSAKHILVLSPGTTNVIASSSGLSNIAGVCTFSGITYNSTHNTISYDINYA